MTSQRSSMRLTRLSGRKKGFSENFVELHLMKKETGMDFLLNFIWCSFFKKRVIDEIKNVVECCFKVNKLNVTLLRFIKFSDMKSVHYFVSNLRMIF